MGRHCQTAVKIKEDDYGGSGVSSYYEDRKKIEGPGSGTVEDIEE